MPLVVAADAAGQLLHRHRFIYAAATDLRVADVAALLAEYKVTTIASLDKAAEQGGYYLA